jgi:hypothetical protein
VALPWPQCAGANTKNTLVLILDADAAGYLSFLKKILRAVDLDFDEDIHFLPAPENLETQLMADPQIASYSKLVLFGIRPSQIGIRDADKAGCCVFQFEKLVCVSAPSLADIDKFPNHKKHLWSALKQAFQSPEVI